MKYLKKLIACIVTVATLGSLTVSPLSANAILDKDNPYDLEFLEYCEKNSHTEAVLIVLHEDGFYDKYYFNSSMDDGLYYCVPPKKVDNTFDLSKVNRDDIVIIDGVTCEGILADMGSYYTQMYYSYDTDEFCIDETYIEKVVDDTTIGESSEPSEETLQHGDINGDGKVNVLDLLQLKKYILKIIDTLD